MPPFTPKIKQASTPTDELTLFSVTIEGIPDSISKELSIGEVNLTESLLSPTLQTSVTINDAIHTNPVKILDLFANKSMQISGYRQILEQYGFLATFDANQQVYRLSNRKPYNYNIETYLLHGCDNTLLINAAKRVSKSWKATTPSQVVTDVLTNCIGAKNIDVEASEPARDYFAENIHPFQVIAQQADVALSDGNDPSFLHFMTYDNGGTHHFRSLNNLTKQSTVFDFVYTEKGAGLGYADPHGIMAYEFPCDFDILSDILNGTNSTSVALLNTVDGSKNLVGDQSAGCGMGGSVFYEGTTNKETGPQAGTPETQIEKYLALRQARLGLLDQDKIALRITVPWNPILHAGKMIHVRFINKDPDTPGNEDDYGTGDYLISTMTHTFRAGGFAFTTLDCVSKTVGQGIV